MTAIPHGERPSRDSGSISCSVRELQEFPHSLWIIVGVALAILVPILATHVRPANHERSIRYRNPRGRQDW